MVLSGSYDTPQAGSQPLLSVIHPDGSAHALKIIGSAHDQLKGEALGLYLDEHEAQVTATFPNASRIQVWNYRTGELIRQINIAEPRGLAYSIEQHKLIVTSAQAKGFMMLDNEVMLQEQEIFALGLAGDGSHLFRLQI